MMIDFLDLLGIHTWDIEMTENNITDAFEEVGLDYLLDDLADSTQSRMEGESISLCNCSLGELIINNMLESARTLLLNAVYPLEPEIETYANGADSRFSIKEDDVLLIKAVTDNDLDFREDGLFIKWIYDELPDEKDFAYIIRDNDLIDALKSLMDNGGYLLWEPKEDSEYSDQEISSKENDCRENPEDATKVFFVGPSGKIWQGFQKSVDHDI